MYCFQHLFVEKYVVMFKHMNSYTMLFAEFFIIHPVYSPDGFGVLFV